VNGALTVGLLAGAIALPAPARAQHQEFVWDFTSCYDLTIRSEGTEFIDAERFRLPGGCHVRFTNPGESWLQMTFVLSGDPRPAAGGGWNLAMYHLAITSEGPTPGLAPVRVLVNGQEVWHDGITPGTRGPGNIWSLAQANVTPYLRQGTNTLRWEFVGGGAAHYWLKIARVGWEPN
jgi:hypothetical protein